MMTLPPTRPKPLRPLKGVRILSLALNLPGPAALLRCAGMGARCIKLEPPARPPLHSADPMLLYGAAAYESLHQGVEVLQADLKSIEGQQLLRRHLSRAAVLITSFRPSALKKLGLDWPELHRRYPQLNQLAIFSATGTRAEEPGHDLTYQAENDLITGLEMPATLYADMSGSLLASEAILQLVLRQRQSGATKPPKKGARLEIVLPEAAAYLALPRAWGLTAAGTIIGGGHAGYRVLPCQDGRVALAALEPHFAQRLCQVIGINDFSPACMLEAETHRAVADWLLGQSRAQLEQLALERDIPLVTMA